MHSRKYRVVTALERTSSRLILAAVRPGAAPRPGGKRTVSSRAGAGRDSLAVVRTPNGYRRADMVIIDAWMQHPSAEFLADPMFDSLRRWARGRLAGDEVPAEATVAAMDAAGVRTGMLCAWWGPRGPLISNDAVAAIIARYPGRFAGVAAVDLARPMDAVRELRRCVRDLGFRALRVVPWLWNLPPDDRRYYPLYAECVQLGIPFCLQVGHTGPLCPSEPGRPIPYLDTVALEFPELVIVGGHIGYPWTAEMISLATKYPNVYIDTSAYKASRYPRELVDYLRGHGRHKVLFGSNHPAWPAADCLQDLPSLGLDDQAADLFLHGNAERVFGLTSPHPPA